MNPLTLLAGRRTYILAALQALATAAATFGFITPEQYMLLAQLFGWPMAATVAAKLGRDAGFKV